MISPVDKMTTAARDSYGSLNERCALYPFFMRDSFSDIFAICRSPQKDSHNQRSVLIIQPFAEEQNKSRRMLSLLQQSLAEQGNSSLIIDLYGTGDSSGELRDADLTIWKENLIAAYKWLQKEYSHTKTTIIGLRTGALLGAGILNQCQNIDQIIAWQPVSDFRKYLLQFLRTKIMAEMLSGNRSKSAGELLQNILDGSKEKNEEEVAGYILSARLIKTLINLNIEEELKQAGRKISFDLFEICAKEGGLSMQNSKLLEQISSTFIKTTSAKIIGSQFWQTQEITELPQLIVATCAKVNCNDG